jgi:hypothetical protein
MRYFVKRATLILNAAICGAMISALRLIALANESVKSLYGERGLMFLNGKAMVIDDLWKNGTAPTAYWLWKGMR